jgi:hypothetical protein
MLLVAAQETRTAQMRVEAAREFAAEAEEHMMLYRFWGDDDDEKQEATAALMIAQGMVQEAQEALLEAQAGEEALVEALGSASATTQGDKDVLRTLVWLFGPGGLLQGSSSRGSSLPQELQDALSRALPQKELAALRKETGDSWAWLARSSSLTNAAGNGCSDKERACVDKALLLFRRTLAALGTPDAGCDVCLGDYVRGQQARHAASLAEQLDAQSLLDSVFNRHWNDAGGSSSSGGGGGSGSAGSTVPQRTKAKPKPNNPQQQQQSGGIAKPTPAGRGKQAGSRPAAAVAAAGPALSSSAPPGGSSFMMPPAGGQIATPQRQQRSRATAGRDAEARGDVAGTGGSEDNQDGLTWQQREQSAAARRHSAPRRGGGGGGQRGGSSGGAQWQPVVAADSTAVLL